MTQVHQDRQRLLNNGVRFVALHIDHKSHPATLALKPGIIKPLLAGPAGQPFLRACHRVAITAHHQNLPFLTTKDGQFNAILHFQLANLPDVDPAFGGAKPNPISPRSAPNTQSKSA
jgi:hypothetical protein